MSKQRQLECRIIITHSHREDLKTEVGMYDPLNEKYVPLGAHGPDTRSIDSAVRGLKERIEREGHRLTFSELRGPR